MHCERLMHYRFEAVSCCRIVTDVGCYDLVLVHQHATLLTGSPAYPSARSQRTYCTACGPIHHPA